MYEIRVEHMTCGGCASRVKKAIHSVDESAIVNVDLKGKAVSVESKSDIDTLITAITNAGYPAAPLTDR